MTVHPLFVHFPIAFLSLYSALEIFRFRTMTKRQWYVPIKTILVSAGLVGGAVALLTGEIDAETLHLEPGNPYHAILEWHEVAGKLSLIAYAIPGLAYLFVFVHETPLGKKLHAMHPKICVMKERFFAKVLHPSVSVTFALLGFFLLSLTGALGAIMVHGPDADPLTRMLYDFIVG